MVGKLILISGPSGVGKDTLINHYLKSSTNPITRLISATTRLPRINNKIREINGEDYYFRDINFFKSNEFLEKEEVYRGSWYGTLLEPVIKGFEEDQLMLKDIDITGSNLARKTLEERGLEKHLIQIGIIPNSISYLSENLLKRDSRINAQRIEKAEQEISLIESSIPKENIFYTTNDLSQTKKAFFSFLDSKLTSN